MTIVTRFAPSPTGMVHIGTARTGLFNMYLTKRLGGKCLLRIEDTDRERSTQEAVDGLLEGLTWLGFEWDGEPIFQFPRAERHAEIARELVARGQAYYCYMTPEEILAEREAAEADGKMWHYDRRWRDSSKTPPQGVKPVIRIKAPVGPGALTLHDEVQGDVTVKYEQLDDMIMLRADGTPTYMLAVVVDDYDMGVTHVVRGDDHLNNMFRQHLIYKGMDWNFPLHAHIPLIHGTDGKKLSKRKGSAAISEYQEMGYLPEAMRNYLLRLGWSHGDEELINDEQAAQWFDLEHIGRSPSQLDFDKLNFINHHYIKLKENNELIDLVKPFIEKEYGEISDAQESIILKAMNGLKERSQNLVELAKNARFYLGVVMDDGAKDKLNQPHAADVLSAAQEVARGLNDWEGKAFIDAVLAKTGFKMGQVGPVLRAALTGTMQSPDMTEVITALGPDEVKARLLAVSK
jgi:glutamyl-tRNA synthetase